MAMLEPGQAERAKIAAMLESARNKSEQIPVPEGAASEIDEIEAIYQYENKRMIDFWYE